MAATIIPTPAFVRRLIPMLLAEVLVVALASLAYVMTRNIIWFVLLPLVMVALLVRIVYLLRAHRDEWRWAMNRNP